MQAAPARLKEPALALLRRSLGTPAEVRGKLARLATVLRGYLDSATLDVRLGQLQRGGLIEEIPTRVQLVVGSLDMLRFWIAPAAADYYQGQGINFTFHQILRVVEEPASMIDPVGFFSTRDGIIGHLMQVVHANPVYDLQLLCMFPDGLDALEEQLEQMLRGDHPRARAIQAIVEEADYHARLLDFVRAWRRDPTIPPLLRGNVARGFSEIEKIFGTLTGAMRYFTTLPTTWAGAARHLVSVKQIAAS